MDMKESTELFQAILQCAPDAMLIADEDGVIILANGAAEQLFGYDKADLVGHKVEILIPKERRAAHVRERDSYRETPRARSMGEVRGITALAADGTSFAADVSLAPLERPEGTYVVSAIRRVSNSNQDAAALRTRVGELETQLARLRGRTVCPSCGQPVTPGIGEP